MPLLFLSLLYLCQWFKDMIYGLSPSFRIIHQAAGSAAAPPVVNHSESLSLISINRSSVALVSASLNLLFLPSTTTIHPPPPTLSPPPQCRTYSRAGYQFHSAGSSAYLLFNKLTTFSHAMNKKAPHLQSAPTPPPLQLNTLEMSRCWLVVKIFFFALT